MEIAKFVVPPRMCREVCANPARNRGVFIGYVGVEAVTLDFNAMPSEHRRVMIHRQFNAPKLLARIGAIAMSKSARPFELRDLTDPHHKAAHLCGFDGWLALVGGVAASSGDPVVTWKVLHPDGVRELYAWLADWTNQPEVPHSATRRGMFRSEREYQEHLAFERSFESASDDPTQ